MAGRGCALKLAMSLDGRTALADGRSQWITGAHARADNMRWRARSSAILTGIGTVLADDPHADRAARRMAAPERPPLRVVVDTHLRTPPAARVLDDSAPDRGVLRAGRGGAQSRHPSRSAWSRCRST